MLWLEAGATTPQLVNASPFPALPSPPQLSRTGGEHSLVKVAPAAGLLAPADKESPGLPLPRRAVLSDPVSEESC